MNRNSILINRADVISAVANCFGISNGDVKIVLEKEYPKAFFPTLTLKEYQSIVKKYKNFLYDNHTVGEN